MEAAIRSGARISSERVELETLVLADNGLTEVSEQIGSLKRLRMLDRGHNKLPGVPETLGDLDRLDFLYLHDNRLSSLPILWPA
jgi:Leucine-rich repeat (LRR) protein